jgi:signal transduction histidine kinase
VILKENLREVPPVMGDEAQLNLVILHLIRNAAQAIGNDVGEIFVRLGLNEIAPNSIKISIIDTGIGIDPTIIDRIFEPFFTTKPVGEGTGLGLAVVHGIVRSHGGSIDIVPNTPKGTRFTITLPVE